MISSGYTTVTKEMIQNFITRKGKAWTFEFLTEMRDCAGRLSRDRFNDLVKEFNLMPTQAEILKRF